MEIDVLASGSSGNAMVVCTEETSVLLDAGISRLALKRRLAALGKSVGELDAVLLSHEHSDHVRGLEVLQRRHPTPVWATAGTFAGLPCSVGCGGELSSGVARRFGQLEVLPVATSHDAREPVGFVISDGQCSVGVCTDTGICTGLLLRRLGDCDLVLIEANHDIDLLRHGPYPWYLKQRIRSRLGHLANHQAEEALETILTPRLKGLVALHLSEQNNQPELVRSLFRRRLGSDLPVGVATRTSMLRIKLEGSHLTITEHGVPQARRSGACHQCSEVGLEI